MCVGDQCKGIPRLFGSYPQNIACYRRLMQSFSAVNIVPYKLTCKLFGQDRQNRILCVRV